ncbi:MAG: hydantoinase/oxoprolinase family protein [Sphingomonadales bacterium]|nr:hydantoinase/oxoprolinase family protein [Sphingomonadales bacterium]
MTFRLGVDVGGTFTDLALIDIESSRVYAAKVPSTPEDSSIGVLNGIARICGEAQIDPAQISHVMHGTTVATNAVLTGKGAKVGLITTKGHRQILHIARSFIPGGLGGWVIYNKSAPMAPLKWTIETDERMGADGSVVTPLDPQALREQLGVFKQAGVDAVTICFINSFANGAHEEQARVIVEEELPGVEVSISSNVIPEMQEYERAVTTVANSFVRPVVSKYVNNLSRELTERMGGVSLNILRSDGGLSSAEAAAQYPVNLLMSGPAGGVAGALWVASQAGFEDIITFDMGGTSTDVALITGGQARLRRETTVGDVTVRASSVDISTVGAGGGSIAHVPELTKALRVGPQSAGAVPGPAAYCKGGTQPTVTDANVVLGYLPYGAQLGGKMAIDKAKAEAAVQSIAEPLGLSLKEAAAGIIDIVNENMFGALRLVSVEQGFDPRGFALMGFGGAGPLHGNALGKLLGCWPVIIPRGPGVLCASGDATTRLRDEASQTFIRRFGQVSAEELVNMLEELGAKARGTLDEDGVPREEQSLLYELDVRYHGQALQITVPADLEDLRANGLEPIRGYFDAEHEKLYTFSLDAEHEFINLRAVAQGAAPIAEARKIEEGGADPSAAKSLETTIFADGEDWPAIIYDRARLKAGNAITGPAIITEMDSTTLILPAHVGEVDAFGNILIRPMDS